MKQIKKITAGVLSLLLCANMSLTISADTAYVEKEKSNDAASVYNDTDIATESIDSAAAVTTLSIQGFNNTSVCISSSEGYLNNNSEVSENTNIAISIQINDYINHDLYINNEKVEPFINGDYNCYIYNVYAAGSRMSIEFREEAWSEDRLSEYFVADIADNISAYYYNDFYGYTARTITTGDYVIKDKPIGIMIDKDKLPEGKCITVNGHKVDLVLNEDGQYYIANYICPILYTNTLKIEIADENLSKVSISGFENTYSGVIKETEDLSDGSVVETGTLLYAVVLIDDYIDHGLYINNKKVELESYLIDEGYGFIYPIIAEGNSMSIEFREEKWSDEQRSRYFSAKVDDEIQLYYCDPYKSILTERIYTGNYINKSTPVCLRIAPEDLPEGAYVTVNGKKVGLSVNNDGQYQLWRYYVEDTSSDYLEVRIEKEDVIKVNEKNFPDANFRSYVSKNFDKDSDGILSEEEISAVTSIDVFYCGISSLKGIEFFTELTYLDAGKNPNLTSLDISANTKLADLNLSQCNLTSLDISANTNLENMNISRCNLTSLDISANTKLKRLYCQVNSISSLNTSNNKELEILCCWQNSLKSLDLTNNTELTELDCYNNSIPSLDLTKNTKLTYVEADNETVITGYNVSKTDLSVSGFNNTTSYVSGPKGHLTGSCVVTEKSYIDIFVEINDYINHELYINGEKVSLESKLSNDNYFFYYETYAEGSEMTIELKEEAWSEERFSEYFVADVDDAVNVYYYNYWYGSLTDKIETGDYAKKGKPIGITVDKDKLPEGTYVTVNGKKVELTLNNNGQYQALNYIPYDNGSDVLKIGINDIGLKVSVITVTENTVKVTYQNGDTESYAFDKVPVEIVEYMANTDIQLCIDYVNNFSEADTVILAEAQLKAVEYVLAHDMK